MLRCTRMGALDQKTQCWCVVAQIEAEIRVIPTHHFFESHKPYHCAKGNIYTTLTTSLKA